MVERVQHLGPELKPELLVPHPSAFSGHPFTGADGGQGADDRDLIAVPLGLDLEHGEAVFLIPKGNALDQAG